LYFAHLKGPDITLLTFPEVKLLETNSVEALTFEPIDFVLENKGSMSGVVYDMYGSFEPSPAFKPFYKQLSVKMKRKLPEKTEKPLDSVGEKDLPVSIDEGGSCVITLECSLKLHPWKKEASFDQIPETSDLPSAIQKVYAAKKEVLRHFCTFLESREPLGTLTLKMKCTGRKLIRRGGMITKQLGEVMDVPNTYKETINSFRGLYWNWDEMFPKTEDIVDFIPSIFPDPLIKELDEILERLKTPVQKGQVYMIDGSSLRDFKRDKLLEGYSERIPVWRFIARRESALIEALYPLESSVDRFNSEARIAITAGEEASQAKIEKLDHMRQDLQLMVLEARAMLGRIRQKLLQEIQALT